MLLIDPDTGRIVDANPAAANFYGWSRKELKGKNIFQINEEKSDNVREKMQASLLQKYNNYIFKHRKSDGFNI